MQNLLTISFLVLFYSQNIAQESTIQEDEIHLEQLLNDLRSSTSDKEKEARNNLFKSELEQVLQRSEAMLYPFAKLTTVGFIDSPDKQIRIINWNIEQDDFSQKYSCFILHLDKKKKNQYVTELKDNSYGMPTQPEGILAANEWYGALYYKIIPIKKGAKTIYTVLGWDYYSSMSQLKVIDAIYLTGSVVKLGSPIFKIGKETHKRMFYEHSKKVTMSLKYEEERNRIIFDHLSPESPSMVKFKSFYVPDMSYDAFIRDGDKWLLQEDVIGVNNSEEGKTQFVYVKNPKTGKVERKEIKTKWINPEDAEAPDGGSEHVAVTPENENDQKKKEVIADPKVDKKDKRDPSNVSFYNDVKKNKRKKKR